MVADGTEQTLTVRQGLPRRPGGEPWPPARTVSAASVQPVSESAPVEAEKPESTDTVATTSTKPTRAKAPRRGLPRRPGEEAPAPAAVAASTSSDTVKTADAAASSDPETGSGAAAATGTKRRTGLPRPGTTSAASGAAASSAAETTAPPTAAAESTGGRRSGLPRSGGTTAAAKPATPAEAPAAVATTTAPRPAPAASVAPPRREPAPVVERKRYGRFTAGQWLGIAVIGGLGLLYAAAMVVLFTRWFVSLDFMRDFLTTYPGETHLPEGAPVGFPAWLAWQHFFNAFFILLIIKTGWQVRTQQRPPAMWVRNNTGIVKTKNPPKRISLTLWAHLTFDALWFLNGVIFVVLLFVTGQWMRVVPTSWDVFPNAISAALQYVSLNWPMENGWVNYNSLQVLAYFATIFIAAPLAAITGIRMSAVWPRNATLNKIYPVEVARAIHFPVMLYFVLFIIFHVALVFATGAIRNLNHMYAAQDDPGSWAGFWIFFASLVVMIGALIAARPLVLAPIAQLMGKVGR